jgi:3-oxoacyl-[acyl-carrier-protein] synthase-3
MTIRSNYAVTAIGAYVPARKLTNYDLEKMVDTNDEWIVKRTGIRERFLAAEDEFSSDLAAKAVENMIREGASVEGVDLVIATCLAPDHITPSVAALVAGKFGLRAAGTWDLHAACSGFAYAFTTAASLLATGQAKKILVVSAETLSKVVDYQDRSTCILFGDAAVAVTIERGEKEKSLASISGTDGDMADKVYANLFSQAVNGVPAERQRVIVQNGQALYTYVMKTISEHVARLLAEAKTTPDQIDWFVPHSANLRMVDALRERIGFPREKVLTSVESYGNTSSASIPLALWIAQKEGKLRRGDRILIYGFGGGLTHAGAILEW